MNDSMIYLLLAALAAGFFWRFVDRIEKKIDKIFDLMDKFALKTEMHELETRIRKLEENQNKCSHCPK